MYKLAKILSNFLILVSTIIFVSTLFLTGFQTGYKFGKFDQQRIDQELSLRSVSSTAKPSATPGSQIKTKVIYATFIPVSKWGGPQLWDVVNNRRVQLGVGKLQVKEEICTIASIRLNQLLDLGKLDGHLGFSNMTKNRPDLKYIFEKYNLSEFLVSGASSPQNAVDLWENSLGHKELLSGGQYVWGCIYAQNGFGVAITAY
jgi:uncharacterized protein YkwD